MDTVIITGGTGLIGRALSIYLESRGMRVIVLTRDPKSHRSSSPRIQYAGWDIAKQYADPGPFQDANYIVHLAGAGVADKKWTKKRMAEIRESRTQSSALLVKMLQTVPHQVKTLVSASAIGWYKKNNPAPAVEKDPAASGFLGETCLAWENSIQPVAETGCRLVILRFGIVLSNQGGAFPEFSKPVRYGIAAILGNGKQIISWIHIEDLCRIIMEALTDPAYSGVYNAVAPQPVNNRSFTLELAKRMKGSFFIPVPVPEFILRMMLGDRSVEVLEGCNVSANKLKQMDFQFIYPNIDAALRDLVPLH